MKKKGWFGEMKRHSEAAKLGWRRRMSSRGFKEGAIKVGRVGRSVVRSTLVPIVPLLTFSQAGVVKFMKENPGAGRDAVDLANEYKNRYPGDDDQALVEADTDFMEWKRIYKETRDDDIRYQMEVNRLAQYFITYPRLAPKGVQR